MKKMNRTNILLFIIAFISFLLFGFAETTMWRWMDKPFYYSQLPVHPRTVVPALLLVSFLLFALCTLLFAIFRSVTASPESTPEPAKKRNYLLTAASVLVAAACLANIGIGYWRVKNMPNKRYAIQPVSAESLDSMFSGTGSAVVYVTFSEDDPSTDAAIKNLAENFPVAILHYSAEGDSYTVTTRDASATLYAEDGPYVLVCYYGFYLEVYDKTAIANGDLLSSLQADATRPDYELYYTPDMWCEKLSA